MPDAIDKLAALFKAATKGEWEYDAGEIGVCRGQNPDGYPIIRMIAQDTMGDIERNAVEPEDGEYIAHAHNMMPRILDVLRVGRELANTSKEYSCQGFGNSAAVTAHVHKFTNAINALRGGGE